MHDQLPEHARANREFWDNMADEWVEAGERAWRQNAPTWGIWGAPDDQVELLPRDMSGMRAIELGCGTGYVSAWMTRRGASVVGIDNSERQLATARRLMHEHGVQIEFLHGSAEEVPYPDGSFDFAVSEYGAAIWCDPRIWIPEAHRLLRPGGELRFLGTHPLAIVCSPESGAKVDDRLHRSYFDMHMQDWRTVEIDPGGVEFNLPISGWFELFHDVGFEVFDFREMRPPASAADDRFAIPHAWALHWPSEQVWHLRKAEAVTR
jgi:SAM-dependent methyltransferase